MVSLNKCLGPCMKHCNRKNAVIMLSVILAISIVANLIMYARIYALSGSQLIPASQAKRLIKSGDITQIVDIRTETEFKLGHYPDSIHLPVNEISEESVAEKKLDLLAGTVVYCNTGQRARVAANKLKKLGFKEVYYIDGLYTSLM